MIIPALVEYYNQIIQKRPNKVARRGQSFQKLCIVIDFDSEGNLLGITPIKEDEAPMSLVIDHIAGNGEKDVRLFHDSIPYFLGVGEQISEKNKYRKKFEYGKNKHLAFLNKVDSVNAQALRKHYENWDTKKAWNNEFVKNLLDSKVKFDQHKYGCLIKVNGKYILEDEEIIKAYEQFLKEQENSNNVYKGIDIITGEKDIIAEKHAQALGTGKLVSFAADSFTAYGLKEGQNASVGSESAFKYVEALRYLRTSTQPKHMIYFGEGLYILYWCTDDTDDICSNIISNLFSGNLGLEEDNNSKEKLSLDSKDALLESLIKNILKANSKIDISNIELGDFYIMGLQVCGESKGRVVTRFMIHSNFGNIIDNVYKHYKRMKINTNQRSNKFLSIWSFVNAIKDPKITQDNKQKLIAKIYGDILKAILMDELYPQVALDRILTTIKTTIPDNKAEDIYRYGANNKARNKISPIQASIIKAVLIKNYHYQDSDSQQFIDRSLTVGLNESNTSVAYLLGRLLAVAERIQERKNSNSDGSRGTTTLTRKYYNSFSSTPSIDCGTIIAQTIYNLEGLKKVHKDESEKLGELFSSITFNLPEQLPIHLSYPEQGEFGLGYFQQKQTFYNNENNNEDTAGNENIVEGEEIVENKQ